MTNPTRWSSTLLPEVRFVVSCVFCHSCSLSFDNYHNDKKCVNVKTQSVMIRNALEKPRWSTLINHRSTLIVKAIKCFCHLSYIYLSFCTYYRTNFVHTVSPYAALVGIPTSLSIKPHLSQFLYFSSFSYLCSITLSCSNSATNDFTSTLPIEHPRFFTQCFFLVSSRGRHSAGT